MADRERFEQVAKDFGHELWKCGLSTSVLKINDGLNNGWYAEIATWAPQRRPKVAVYFDRWLETSDRHFWFGFEGSKAQIESIYESMISLNGKGKAPAIFNNDHFEKSTGTAISTVNAIKGFVYEKYDRKPHYLGMYDIGFNPESPVVK